MAGRTSLVTHFRKRLASGFRLVKMRLYSPDSLIALRFCGPPGVSVVTTPFSSSSKSAIASRGLAMPRISHTSLATNQGSPSFTMVRTRLSSNVNSTGRFFGFAAESAISSKGINTFLVKGLPLDQESGQEAWARALPHDWPRRDCLGREGSVGGNGANENREMESIFAPNRRAEGRACHSEGSGEPRRNA